MNVMVNIGLPAPDVCGFL